MNLDIIMQNGITKIFMTAGRFYLNSHKGRAFLAQTLPQIKRASNIRKNYQKEGTHIPPFLIASIATQCNLTCTGCYARAGGACGSQKAEDELNGVQWQGIFREAASIGVSFILLAGGEPLLRRDIMEAAAANKKIVFPVFTNGTMLSEDYLTLLDENRNLIPVLSIEGEQTETDERRGVGIYEKVKEGMSRLAERGILFGASVTVTKTNIDKVTSAPFLQMLREKGCGLVFFIEYVPVSQGSEYLTLDQENIDHLNQTVLSLRKKVNDMIILSFPGDEAAMGGCLASGRGFFHINASGGAEPCPFSPYAKHNLKNSSLLDVLRSEYFKELKKIAMDFGVHQGGCTLFKAEEQVLSLSRTLEQNSGQNA